MLIVVCVLFQGALAIVASVITMLVLIAANVLILIDLFKSDKGQEIKISKQASSKISKLSSDLEVLMILKNEGKITDQEYEMLFLRFLQNMRLFFYNHKYHFVFIRQMLIRNLCRFKNYKISAVEKRI